MAYETAAAQMSQPRGLGGIAGGEAAGRQGQVVSEITYLENGIAQLGSVIEMLENRLVCTLRCEPPSPTNENNQVSEVMVPLADQIRANRYNVHRLINVIESITRRLEV